MVRDCGRWWWVRKKREREREREKERKKNREYGRREEWSSASKRTITDNGTSDNGAMGNGERWPRVREKERKKMRWRIKKMKGKRRE